MVRHDRRPPGSLVRHYYYARGGTGLYYGPLANQTFGTPSPPPPPWYRHAIGSSPEPPATGAARTHTRAVSYTACLCSINVRVPRCVYINVLVYTSVGVCACVYVCVIPIRTVYGHIHVYLLHAHTYHARYPLDAPVPIPTRRFVASRAVRHGIHRGWERPYASSRRTYARARA